MRRMARAAFVVLLIVAVAYIVATTRQLPAQVASHFGNDRHTSGWMTRTLYLSLMVGFATLLPTLIVAAIAMLPRVVSRPRNPARRARRDVLARRNVATTALADHAPWLGCLLSTFIAGLHYTILEANALTPPHLPAGAFLVLMAGFLGLLTLWVYTLVARLRRPH